MSDNLLSARAVVVSASNEQRDLLRQAAAVATLPVEIIEHRRCDLRAGEDAA